MALMVLVVLSVAGFLSIESRLSAAQQAGTQARLSALASLRLAVGHLQQEAGADRRVTARADITADATQPGWTWSTIRNPMWTGVWRTDKPEQPPAWLISGRHDAVPGTQSVSLTGKSDYETNQWIPWQSDYTATATTAGIGLVTLVGDASATAAETASASDPGRPDGRVSLPSISSPDTATRFKYAYWIGDEGIKARANLDEPRLTASIPASLPALRGTARNGMELLAGFEATTPGATFTRLAGAGDLPLLAGFNNTPVSPVPATAIPNRRCQPDVTYWSTGLITDSFWGGVRIDLSTAFEQDDAAFITGEFGEGDGRNTLLFWEMARTTKANPPIMTILDSGTKIWQPMWWCDPTGITGIPNSTPTRYDIAPIYTFNWDDPDNSAGRSGGNPQIRGPTWMIIRDYHRLYRQMSWSGSAATIRARTVFPNVISNEKMQVGTGGTYHYSHIFNRMDNTNFSNLFGDPFATDVSSGPFGSSSYVLSNLTPTSAAAHGSLAPGTPCIRPIKVASTPYISRQMIMFGLQQDSGQLRIVMSPITVLHNPYNVALNLRRENPSDSAAMRVSFRNWNSWTFTMSSSGVNGGTPWSRSLQDMTRALDSSGYNGENLRTYIPEIVLQPGEFRVFSPTASAPVPFTRIATAGNTYDFLGGFWVPCLTSDTSTLATYNPGMGDSFSIGFVTGGALYGRHLMSCWPGDSIMEAATTGSDAMYNKCSEHTELFDSQMSAIRNGTAAAITYPAGTWSSQVPSVGSPPKIFAVVDYSVRWPKDALPYPILTHSNPLALMTRGDATGWSPGGADKNGANMGPGYATTSPSYRLTVSSGGGNWSTAFETGDGAAKMGLGGASNSSGQGGRISTVFTELPMHPPISLAQYAHANFGMRDQDPLYCIGSSFASPNLPLDKVVSYRVNQNWTDVDRAYLANIAIWDRYFLSSASPEPTPPSTAINVTVVDTFTGAAPPWSGQSSPRTLNKVIDDFVDGTTTLLNPRMRIWSGRNRTASSTTTPTRKDIAVKLTDYKQAAAHLVIDGAFNINSTSVDAWAAVLGGTKRLANGGDTATTPSATRNARFPRAARSDSTALSDPRAAWTNDKPWTGFAALDDTQIRLLARAIVDEIRFRTQYTVRTPIDRQLRKGGTTEFPERRFRGATPGSTVVVPTPFLGLSQFVNRFLDVTSPGNAVAKAGCLQAAIARAETEGAEISNRVTPAPEVNQASLASNTGSVGQQSWTGYPEGIEITDAGTRSAGITSKSPKNQAHAALFAPGSVLQQDILAAIGPHINARSDTFLIRAYAEIRPPGGSETGRGRAWVEAVVQRTPDYCDSSEAPETTPPTKVTNVNLGRRFRIVSVRWLNPSEI
ncbi:MAG: hypothetical protein ACO23N_06975 [Opitutales bacterium]